MKLPVSPRFASFAAVGALGTAIDFLLFFLFYTLLGWSLVCANLFSYGTGLTCSFYLNRRFTFADSAHRSNARLWLSLAFGYLGLFLNTALVYGLSLLLPVWIGKVLVVGVVLVYNYAANKYIVFAVK